MRMAKHPCFTRSRSCDRRLTSARITPAVLAASFLILFFPVNASSETWNSRNHRDDIVVEEGGRKDSTGIHGVESETGFIPTESEPATKFNARANHADRVHPFLTNLRGQSGRLAGVVLEWHDNIGSSTSDRPRLFDNILPSGVGSGSVISHGDRLDTGTLDFDPYLPRRLVGDWPLADNFKIFTFGDDDPKEGDSWTPPVGIPHPGFCVDGTAEEVCPDCTEEIVSSLVGLSDIPPGTIVTLEGGPYTGSTLTIRGYGTAEAPIFVRGASPANPTVIHRPTKIFGSHITVEHIDFDFDGGYSGLRLEGDHICLRHNEVHDMDPGCNSTVVYANESEDVVIYDNYIHDNGDFDYVGEQDVHGIGASHTQGIWIVDNYMHHSRGDSVQFGHRAGNTVGEIYIGRNEMHSDGENCVDIKEASNVVISENVLYDPSDGNPAVALHDCPLNAAVIYNEINDADAGVTMASLEDACADYMPIDLFVIRNEIRNIPGDGIQAWGTGKTYHVSGNTFTNVDDPVDIDQAEEGSFIDEGEEGLSEVFDAFFSIYGIDISDY